MRALGAFPARAVVPTLLIATATSCTGIMGVAPTSPAGPGQMEATSPPCPPVSSTNDGAAATRDVIASALATCERSLLRPVETPLLPTEHAPPVFQQPVLVQEGGYSFRPLEGQHAEVRESWAYVHNGDSLFMNIVGLTTAVLEDSDEDLLDLYFDHTEVLGEHMRGRPREWSIAGSPGLWVDIASYQPLRAEGAAVVVRPSPWQFFIAVGESNIARNPMLWQEEGLQAFIAILSSVEFLDLPSPSYPCRQSSDPHYGYSAETPIEIGGRGAGGTLHERAFLGALRGPDGEAIQYDWAGSEPSALFDIDRYLVSYSGDGPPVLLYFRIDLFRDPRAPVGFLCGPHIPVTVR